MANALLAKDILKKIIAENVPFSLALKQAFKHGNIAKEDKSVVSAVVGCALRHYIVMERLLKDAYPEIESEGLCALLVAFSNALFIKKLAQDVLENAYAIREEWIYPAYERLYDLNKGHEPKQIASDVRTILRLKNAS